MYYYLKFIFMKKNLYFFRHGETNYNLENRWYGCSIDTALNDNGVEQAKTLADKVANLGMSVLYCSPLLRAVQTANVIVQRIGIDVPIVILQNLREGNFGVVEGVTFDEVYQQFGKKFVDEICWPTTQNWDNAFPQGETKHNIFNRVLGCLNYIIYGSGDVNVGVVCHAGVLSALKCGLGLEATPNPNCSILHLQFDTETCTFVQVND